MQQVVRVWYRIPSVVDAAQALPEEYSHQFDSVTGQEVPFNTEL